MIPDNFHGQKEENRPIRGKISLFPNPNTINNFMMAIGNHEMTPSMTPSRRSWRDEEYNQQGKTRTRMVKQL